MKVGFPTRVGRRTQRGFSLVELMVVVVIIGLLAAAVTPYVLRNLSDGRWARVKSDLSTMHAALTEYAIVNGGRYPDDLEALVTPDESGHTYLETRVVPWDPWDHPYEYEPPSGDDPRPRVFTLGNDGAPGGEGNARDLSNLDLLDGRGRELAR